MKMLKHYVVYFPKFKTKRKKLKVKKTISLNLAINCLFLCLDTAKFQDTAVAVHFNFNFVSGIREVFLINDKCSNINISRV